LLTPDNSIGFSFDFTEKFKDRGFNWWSPGMCSFNLWVIASDLSGDVTLTYVSNQYWRTLRVSRGAPWWVYRKIVGSFFRQRYYRIFYKFRPPKVMLKEPGADKPNAQTEASSEETSGPHDSGTDISL